MTRLNRYCVVAGLAALGCTAPAAVLAQDNPAPLPLETINAALTDTDTNTDTGTGPARPPTLAEQVQALQQQLARQADQFNQRLNQQAQRIERLEQTIAQLKRPQRAHTGKQSHTAPDAAEATPTSPDIAAPAASETADVAADDSGDSPSPEQPHAEDTIADPEQDNPLEHARCTSALDERFQFDVFFQGAGEDDVGAAVDRVQAVDLVDWFVLADADRLYVGRYGACTTARERRADVHQRTGLPLTIAAVEPNPSANADKDTAHENNRQSVVQGLPMGDAPFLIIGVERRGAQAYLGVAADTPRQLGDITWLAPGQTYGSWRLEAIHRQAGAATFVTQGRTVAVRLPE